MFHHVFQSSPIAITVTNLSDGSYVDVNPAAERLLGSSRAELMGRRRAAWETALAPGARDELLRLFTEQGRVEEFPCILTTPTGISRDCLLSIETLELDGEIYAFTHIVDVSVRKRAEEARRASEAHVRAVMACTADIIFTVDRQLRIQYINRVPAGLTVEEVLGTSALDYVLPEHRQVVERSVHEVLANGQPSAYEIQARGDHGTMCWYDTRLTLLTNSGDPDQVLLVTQDITERKQAEESVRQTRNLFTLLFHSSPTPTILTMLPERRFLDINAAAETLIGHPRQELIGQTPDDFSFFVDAEEHRQIATLLAAQGHIAAHEILVRTSAGAAKECILSIETLHLNGRQYALTQLVDISAQKQTERALRETEYKYRTLVEQSPAVVYVAESGERWRYISPQVEHLLGYSAGTYQANPQLWKDSIHPDDRPLLEQAIRQMAGRSGPLTVEYRMATADGRLIWVRDTSEVVTDTTTARAIIHGVMYDITERKEAEQALERAAARLQLLGDASTVFAEAGMDEQALLERLAHLTAEALAAGCVVRLLRDEAPRLAVATVYDANPALQEAVATIFGHAPIDINDPHPAAQVVRSGQPLLFPEVDLKTLRGALAPELWPTLDLAHLRGGLIVPLRVRGETLGCLVLVRHRPEQPAFTQDDLALAQDLGNRAALALANARLYQAVQVAQRVAQQAHARLEALITSLPTGIGYLDREMRYQLVNPALAAINGHSPAAHVGRPVGAVLPDLASQIEPLLRQVLDTGTTVSSLEIQNARPSLRGDPSTWLVNYFPVPGPADEIAGVGVAITDITASKEAELRLRQSEVRFATIFERSPIALGISRLSTGKITDVNVAFLALYGYTRDEIIGRTTLELGLWARPEDRQHVLEQLRSEQRIARFEVVARTASGEDRPVLLSGELVPINDEPHVLMQIMDLSARKQAERELQELNHTLEERVRRRTAAIQDLYDHAPTGYYSLDAEGRIARINQTLLDWLGYAREEVLGRPFSDIIIQEHRGGFASGFHSFKERGELRDVDGELLRKDGSTFPVLLNATAIYDADGAYVSSRATVLDNTGRRQAEEALRESEEQNRLLFEESPEAVALFDQQGRIVRANRALAQLSGYPREHLLEQTPAALGLLSRAGASHIASDTRPQVQHGSREARAALTFTRPDGETRVVDALVFALTIRGQRHYLAAMHDITAERRTEEMLRMANAELARAARAKDEFLANMSHELRTPLNAILGRSESLQDAVYGPLSERQLSAIGAIEAGGRHLLTLINDILDLAKVEAGRLELQPEHVLLHEVCQVSLLFVREQALKKHLRLDFHLSDQKARMEVDPTRLKQMLVNLLSNAVKFTPAGGTVGLDVVIDERVGGVRFAVHDTGIGIAPEDMGRLFQPFSQLDPSLNRAHEGTGLGLALVRRLAELHGGSVTVASTPGEGSCFTIALPYRDPLAEGISQAEAQTAQPTGAEPMKVDTRRVRVLLAEDNEANIGALGDYLRARGYEVFLARDGYEALAQADEVRPELILMDIQMPRMNGLEATRRLRAQPTFAATPIIALTALAMPGDKERCLAAGATAYMTKPVSLRGLAETIQQLLEQ